ncbi:hypothetical protein NIASO_00525 [Niabella soli DSM 19437]|uniref:Uncharacterized protein n=1 Tax=Niabella soli DSM 19437 TaxID=929713 RepID=W0F1Z3_9BACT|nr:hypothetical protein NIASO_00525 [Niabella soli DSM 19437]
MKGQIKRNGGFDAARRLFKNRAAGRCHNQACSAELTGSAPARPRNRGRNSPSGGKRFFAYFFIPDKSGEKVREETK